MKTKQTAYTAYLLRIWRTQGLRQPAWRASLENAATHEVRGFGSWEALVAFLQEVMQRTESER